MYQQKENQCGLEKLGTGKIFSFLIHGHIVSLSTTMITLPLPDTFFSSLISTLHAIAFDGLVNNLGQDPISCPKFLGQ